MTLYVDIVYTKVVIVNKIYNFIVNDFLFEIV
jgi:hypothetical protein